MLGLSALASPAGACPLTNPNCAVEKVKETADNTTTDIKEQADNTVDQVNDTVDHVEEKADGVVKDVKETVDHVDEKADGVVKDVKDTAGDAAGKLEEKVNETLNPGNGGGSPETPTKPKVDDPTKPGVKDGEQKRPRSADTRNARGAEGPGGDARERASRAETRSALDLADLPLELDRSLPTSFTSSSASRPELSPGLGDTAIEAVKAFAFPLALAIIVGAFLVIQHRVDRKDPKLLFAPVDQDLMSFD